MKFLKAGACALALLTCAPVTSGCASLGVGQPVISESAAKQALIDCDTAYVAIATIVNALPADKKAAGERIKSLAWDALLAARALYAANQKPDVAALAALLVQAQALMGSR